MQGLQAFYWLMRRDFTLIRRTWWDSFIDSILFPSSIIIIAGYVFPALGLPLSYGGVMVVGGFMFMCWCTAGWVCAAPMISDLEGDKTITYELTLPLPTWMMFFQKVCSFAMKAMILNGLTLVIGKLILLDRFDLSNFSLPKFLLMYLVANLLFGVLAVFLAFWLETSANFFRFWMRVCAQLVMFSGFQFTWATLYGISKLFAYAVLFSPVLYAFEGMRAAILGQAGNINYWTCLGINCGLIIVFTLLGLHFCRKLLDSV